ncbi:MAG TPA: hypothetical protein EYG88_08715 [Desulfocapsa sulfexigens]|nr:hypothetical protein [Desulfocapsa sulfexigens]
MNQTQQSIPYPIPNAVLAVSRHIPPKFPDDTLLRDFKGEVLIVQYGKISEVFDLNREKLPVPDALRFINAAQRKATYLVGGLTSGGGRFRSITREEAIGKIGKRIFEVI